ncbi:hypothetical protein ACHAO1_006543 [Botrytis cinerea]
MELAMKKSLNILDGENIPGAAHDENTRATGYTNIEENTGLSDIERPGRRIELVKRNDSESAVNANTGDETIAQIGKGKKHRSDSGIGISEDLKEIANCVGKLNLSDSHNEVEPSVREKSFSDLWNEFPQSTEPWVIPNIDFSALDNIFEDLNNSIKKSRNIDPQNVDAVDNSKCQNAFRTLMMKAALWGSSHIPDISKVPTADEKEDREEKKSLNPSAQTAHLKAPIFQTFFDEPLYFTDHRKRCASYRELFIKRTYLLAPSHKYKTIAHINFGHDSLIYPRSVISGWEDWTNKVRILCRNIGHQLAVDERFDRDTPGSFNACHAEKKLVAYYFAQAISYLPALMDENHFLFRPTLPVVAPRGVIILVSKPICYDCRAFINAVKDHYQLHNHFHVQWKNKDEDGNHYEEDRV